MMSMFENGILEVCMLLLFALAWPISIRKSLRSRTSGGKSLVFMLTLVLGYLCGIANKFAIDQVNYVLIFYIFNITLVSVDIALWFRNNALDKRRDAEKISKEE